MIKIDRKAIGTDNPAGRGEQSSRELLSKLQLFKGEKGIKPHKKDDQDGQGNQGADTEQIWGNMFQYRQIAKQEPLQRSAEYHEYKRHNADQDKDNGVAGINQAADHIIPPLATVDNPVQAAFYAHHPPGGRPYGDDRSHREDSSRSRGVQIGYNRFHKRIYLFRKQPGDHQKKICLGYGWNQLNHCKKDHDKGKE